MAVSYKDIIITPYRSDATYDPKIDWRGANSSVNTSITTYIYPGSNGTLSFEGSSGQIFSITNDLTGSIFSVNDISGVPSVDVNADGTVALAPYSGSVAIGSTSAGSYKLNVTGTLNATSTITQNGTAVVYNSGTWSININGSAASATNASAATNATYATSAGSATNATYATSAGSATNASAATNAGYATNAGDLTSTQSSLGYSLSGQGITYGGQGGPQVRSQGSGAAMMSFHRPGAYAINFGLGTDNQMRVGGWSFGGSEPRMVYESGTWSINVNGSAGYASSAGYATTAGNAYFTNGPTTLNFRGNTRPGTPSFILSNYLDGYVDFSSPNQLSVASATNATYATSAGSATNATYATNTTYATNAGYATYGGTWSTVNNGGTTPFNNTIATVDFSAPTSGLGAFDLVFSGVTSGGAALFIVQLGSGGGIVSSGYLMAASTFNNSPGNTQYTTGFYLNNAGNASYQWSGVASFRRESGSTAFWACTGLFQGVVTNVSTFFAGYLNLNANLTTVRITQSTGNFDGGRIGIYWHG